MTSDIAPLSLSPSLPLIYFKNVYACKPLETKFLWSGHEMHDSRIIIIKISVISDIY